MRRNAEQRDSGMGDVLAKPGAGTWPAGILGRHVPRVLATGAGRPQIVQRMGAAARRIWRNHATV